MLSSPVKKVSNLSLVSGLASTLTSSRAVMLFILTAAFVFGVLIRGVQADDGALLENNIIAVFAGEDRDGDGSCYINVLRESMGTDCTDYAVHVVTSYRHGDGVPGTATLTHPNNNFEMLTTSADSVDFELRATRPGLVSCGYRGMTVFSQRWLHGDHYHTSTCRNLVQL